MNKIYVGNVSFNVTEEEIRKQFGEYGNISDVALIRDRVTNRLKGFCFITFETEEEAQKALEMNGKYFLGRQLRVNMAQEHKRDSNSRNN